MSNSKTDMSEASSLTLENLGAELSIKLSLIKKFMCEAMMLYLITYKYQEVTSLHFEVLQTRFGVNKLNKRVCFSERRSQ